MAIGEFSQGLRGLIQQAAEGRLGSAATNEVVAAAARAAGLTMSFEDFTNVARLYGRFVGIREGRITLQDALDVLGRTGLDQGVTVGMLPQATYARPMNQQLPYPLVRVHYQATVLDPTGKEVPGVFRSFDLSLPQVHTVGGILDLAEQVAGSQAGGYGEQLVSVDPSSVFLEQF